MILGVHRSRTKKGQLFWNRRPECTSLRRQVPSSSHYTRGMAWRLSPPGPPSAHPGEMHESTYGTLFVSITSITPVDMVFTHVYTHADDYAVGERNTRGTRPSSCTKGTRSTRQSESQRVLEKTVHHTEATRKDPTTNRSGINSTTILQYYDCFR